MDIVCFFKGKAIQYRGLNYPSEIQRSTRLVRDRFPKRPQQKKGPFGPY